MWCWKCRQGENGGWDVVGDKEKWKKSWGGSKRDGGHVDRVRSSER